MKVQKWMALLLTCIIMAGLVVSCGPTPITEVVEKVVKETVVVEKEVEVTKVVEVEKEVVVTPTPEPEVTGPVYGGILRIAVTQDVTGLLPGSTGGGWELFVMLDGLYDSLLEYDDEMNLIPGLAESWELNEDENTMVLHLQKGVTFHDGTSFNAEAVKVNLERFVNPTGIVTFDLSPDLESVEVVDEYTAKLHYTPDARVASFIYNLCQDPGQMVSPTAMREKGEEWVMSNPVGTGPFMLDSWEPGTEIRYKRNPNYWRTDEEGNQLPYLDGITWKRIQDDTARTIALLSDEIDVEVMVPARDFDALSTNENINLWVQKGAGVCMATYNHTEPPFDIKENREAMRAVTSYEAIRESAWHGMAELPTGGNMPPAMWPFDLMWEGNPPVLKRDVEKAKELLAKAGNPDGFKVDLIYEPWEAGRVMAEVIQASAAEVGIEVELVKTEFARFIEVLTTDSDAHKILLYCHGRLRINPEEYYTREWAADGAQNFSQWADEEFTEMVKDVGRTADRDERVELLREIENILIEGCHGNSLANAAFIHGTHARVQGWRIHPVGELRYRWVWLKP